MADYFVGRIKAFPVNDREVGGFTGFFAFHLLQQKAERSRASPVEAYPALLLFAGSSRRSGCVPAEPYPPLE